MRVFVCDTRVVRYDHGVDATGSIPPTCASTSPKVSKVTQPNTSTRPKRFEPVSSVLLYLGTVISFVGRCLVNTRYPVAAVVRWVIKVASTNGGGQPTLEFETAVASWLGVEAAEVAVSDKTQILFASVGGDGGEHIPPRVGSV